MIAALKGDKLCTSDDMMVIMTKSGVAYEVAFGDDLRTSPDQDLTVFCSHVFNENEGRDVLLGYATIEARNLAEFISSTVDRVGPKMAHRIATSITRAELVAAVEQDSHKLLSGKVKGLGTEKAMAVLRKAKDWPELRHGPSGTGDGRIPAVLGSLTALGFQGIRYEAARVRLIELASANPTLSPGELLKMVISTP